MHSLSSYGYISHNHSTPLSLYFITYWHKILQSGQRDEAGHLETSQMTCQ